MNITPLTIDIAHQWEPAGRNNPADLLLATVYVAGCPVHLEAVRVDHSDDHQTAADPDYATTLDHAYAINGAGPFATATIAVDGERNEYVIVATSFAD